MPGTVETQESRGHRLMLLRRSSASGIHRKTRKDRRNAKLKAITQSRKDW
jgi:hypothetical protein